MLQLCCNVIMSFDVTESGAVHYGHIVEGAEQVPHHHDNLEEEFKMF